MIATKLQDALQNLSNLNSTHEIELRKHLRKKDFLDYCTAFETLKQSNVTQDNIDCTIYYFNNCSRVIERNDNRFYEKKITLKKLDIADSVSLFVSKEEHVNDTKQIQLYEHAITEHFVSIAELIKTNNISFKNFSNWSITKNDLSKFKYEKLIFKNEIYLVNEAKNNIEASSIFIKLPNQQIYVTSIKYLKKKVLNFDDFTFELCEYSIKKKKFYSIEIEMKKFDNKTTEKITKLLNFEF